ncbi:hypothetical protein [Sphingobacterium faecium]|uniref:hypothetical protein n=1 Tax=Sphingobacterium faecium TaxID=34087 RepID=UPI002469BC6C|nr:hypothetical protein [Sphingobacterium faecium]MDH5825802.1 hypothetical protein [Sphingobacterium faecium]
MKNNLENVHVIIYSRKMLNIAISLLKNEGQTVSRDIVEDYYKGCNILQYLDFDGYPPDFDLYRTVFEENNSQEITLTQLIELVISSQDKQMVMIGDWVYTELINHPENGFSVMKIDNQYAADLLNIADSPQKIKILDPDLVEELRKGFL